MLSSEEIALELVKIEKEKPSSNSNSEKESIKMYEEYLEKVHKAYNKHNS